MPGVILEGTRSSDEDELEIWHAAGRALRALHDLNEGEFFGSCHRDGTPCEDASRDARRRVLDYLQNHLERGTAADRLTKTEIATAQVAQELVGCFEGIRPVPCHGDYCPANWLVSATGTWTGVIDFEMARWDTWVADLARLPDWEWVERPRLSDALISGYGRTLSPDDKLQLLIARIQYALTAVVWGGEYDYRGFAKEGHRALEFLALQLP